jgi:hypothetical protein
MAHRPVATAPFPNLRRAPPRTRAGRWPRLWESHAVRSRQAPPESSCWLLPRCCPSMTFHVVLPSCACPTTAMSHRAIGRGRGTAPAPLGQERNRQRHASTGPVFKPLPRARQPSGLACHARPRPYTNASRPPFCPREHVSVKGRPHAICLTPCRHVFSQVSHRYASRTPATRSSRSHRHRHLSSSAAARRCHTNDKPPFSVRSPAGLSSLSSV